MAIKNKIEACKIVASEEYGAYRTMATEGRLAVTSSLTGGKRLRGPLAPLGRGVIGGTIELVTPFIYSFDRLVVGKSAQGIREQSEEVIGLIKLR